MKNIKDYDLEDLKKELVEIGEKPFRAEQIFKWLYQEKVKEFDEMTNLSLALREKLKENYTICNYKILRKQESKDGTIKYLFDVLDGNAIETVLMSYHHGYSICVSSQIGCKMGCKFCASTGINFIRSLTSGEIVEQILAVEQDTGVRISNVVFMGIGEPLNNYTNVVNAIRIINNPKGLNIGARHISVSTSGLVPGIYRLAEENIQCTLSISLHATNNEKRSSMMPVNNAFPIEELMQACKDYIAKTNRRISFEYALAKDNNDNLEDAKELVKLLHGMLCHVNLIPINKIENGAYSKSSNDNIMKFRDYLNDRSSHLIASFHWSCIVLPIALAADLINPISFSSYYILSKLDNTHPWSSIFIRLPQYSHFPANATFVGAPQFGQFADATFGPPACVSTPLFLTNVNIYVCVSLVSVFPFKTFPVFSSLI